MLGLKISLLVVFIFFLLYYLLPFPTMHFYDRFLGGDEEFIQVAEGIKNNETDVLAIVNNALDWFNSKNFVWDINSIYKINRFPYYFPRSLIRPLPSWLIYIGRGGCSEYAYLVEDFMNYFGIPVRVVHNPTEDHAWNEIYNVWQDISIF